MTDTEISPSLPPTNSQHQRLPSWLRDKRLNPSDGRNVKRMMREANLHTVCEEARCPNLGQCFTRGTATFLIMGERCTRHCGFCNISTGKPGPLDPEEPRHLAEAAAKLGLSHVVITSVTRDDLPDGGAEHFAQVIRALRQTLPRAAVEVLVPDFQGRRDDVATVLKAGPDVFNHNVETVPRLYKLVRPGADFAQSLAVLRQARDSSQTLVKSGFMVGLGETDDDIRELFPRLVEAGIHVVTVGQYLRPNMQALAVQRYVDPQTFAQYREWGLAAGLDEVFSGPLVRSSYLADEVRARALQNRESPLD